MCHYYNHPYIIYKISKACKVFRNPLNLHQNAKVNHPYGIVWCVHSQLSEQYINMKSAIHRDLQVRCVTSFRAILIVVCFNGFMKDYNGL